MMTDKKVEAQPEDGGEWVMIPRELAENFLRSTEVPRFKRILSAALSTTPQPPADTVTIPEGMALVPIHPTREMQGAAASLAKCDECDGFGGEVHQCDIYKAMLSAAPEYPKAGPVTLGREEWQPIESCPAHRLVLFYREDSGVFAGQYTYCADWVSDEEQEKEQYNEETLFGMDCWSFNYDGAFRCEADLKPTHWMPLPEAPKD